MENSLQSYSIAHTGKGAKLFKIFIVNWILTIITLGIYYPWARAKTLAYFYEHTTLNNEPFKFSGTGKEMFKGFIKAVLILGIIYGVSIGLTLGLQMPIAGGLFLYAALIALAPFAIHGSLKYRLSRSSWRTIRMGYRGNFKELTQNLLKWILLTIITFGIYSFWLKINLRKYVYSNSRLGNQKFEFKGTGGEFFGIFFGGYILTGLTLGIYGFWWYKHLFNFYTENSKIYNDNNEEVSIKSSITAGAIFTTFVGNFFIILFTLGFGTPWAITRMYKLHTSSLQLEGNINLDKIQQTEADYKDATGDDLSSMLEIDLA